MRKISMATVALMLVALSIAAVKPGDVAPSFALQDQDGKTVSLADLKGKIVVLEWFNEECPYVVRHHETFKTMSDTAAKYKDKDVVWLAINSTSGKDNAANKSIADKWSIKYAILNDSAGTVGKEYGAKTTPHMFIIDKEGKIAYKGGIDNDKADKKPAAEKTNYVDKALAEIIDGKPVSVAETEQYGCGVKYAK